MDWKNIMKKTGEISAKVSKATVTGCVATAKGTVVASKAVADASCVVGRSFKEEWNRQAKKGDK